MAAEFDRDTREKLNEMRVIITRKLHEALTSDKPPKASMINAAVTWMKSLGVTEEPIVPPADTQAALARKLAPKMVNLPFLTESERTQLQEIAAQDSEDSEDNSDF
jgi:hypothetical protein